MAETSTLTELQETAFSLLENEGELYQSDLWKRMDIGSRSGSRVAQALAEKGLIKREETTRDGRKTHLLTFIETEDAEPGGVDTERSDQERLPDIGSFDLPSHDVHLSPTQKRAAELIYDRGELTQSELWKTLDVASRTGTRASRALADAGLINRVETMENGRKTYVLTPVSTESTAGSEDKSRGEGVSVDSERVDAVDGETLSESERQAYDYIMKTSGVPQNSLRSCIEGDDETIAAVVQSLLAKDLIRRTEETYYGRLTYWVEPMAGSNPPASA